jgi:hypothetical protein
MASTNWHLMTTRGDETYSLDSAQTNTTMDLDSFDGRGVAHHAIQCHARRWPVLANESFTVGSGDHELDRRAIKLEQFVE